MQLLVQEDPPLNLKEVCLDLKRRLEHMKVRLAESEAESGSLRGHELFLKLLLRENKQSLEDLQKRLEKALARNEILQDKIDQLKGVSTPQENEEIQALTDQVKEAKNQEERLKQRLEKYADLLVAREKQLLAFKDYQTRFQKAQETIRVLELNLKEKEEELSAVIHSQYTQNSQFEEKKKQIEQLERAIQFLRERNEESQLETKNLEEELLTLQGLLDETKSALKEALDSIDELKKALIAADEFKKELHDIKGEKEKVIRHAGCLQKEIEEFKNRLDHKQQEIEKFKKESQDKSRDCDDKSHQIIQLNGKNSLLHEEIAHKEWEIVQAKEALMAAEEETLALQGQFAELKYSLKQEQSDRIDIQKNFKSTQEELLEKIKEQEEMRGQLMRLNLERKGQEDTLLELKRKHDESESNAQNAKQHLGKKVKETTLLAETLEKTAKEQQELHTRLKTIEAELTDAKKALDVQTQEKCQLEKRFETALSSSEMKVREWEDKYFKLQEGLKQSEEENRQLKEQREKFEKLQTLLTSLGGAIGHPVGITALPDLIPEEPKIEPPTVISLPQEENPKSAPYKNLFDYNPQKSKIKSDFFD